MATNLNDESLMDVGLAALAAGSGASPEAATAALVGVASAVVAIGAVAGKYWYGVRWREPVRAALAEGEQPRFVEGYIPYIGPCESLASAQAWVERHGNLPEDAQNVKIRRGALADGPGKVQAGKREDGREMANKGIDRKTGALKWQGGMKCFWPSTPQAADFMPG